MTRKHVLRFMSMVGLTLLLASCDTATPATNEPSETVAAAFRSALVGFLTFLPRILAAVVLFVVTVYLALWISKLFRRLLERRRTDPGMTLLVYHVSRWTIVILGTIAALDLVNFQVTAFLAGLGILGFTVGFALQDISQNVVAGFLLLIQKPFELGDLIQIDDYTGRVLSVDLRSTELCTRDNHNVLIPNASVFTKPIINFSRQATWRISLPIGVSYESDLELVQEVTLRTIQKLPDVLDDPAPKLHFHKFNDYSIDFIVSYWIDGRVTEPFTATHPAIIAIQKAFKQTGIEIPYPIQTEIQVRGKQDTK